MRIYALMWGDLVLYVGKTLQTLPKRACGHRKTNNTASSRFIPDHIDWEIVLLDTVSDEEGLLWEQYYYDELMPLYNLRRPGQTKHDYYSRNIESTLSRNRKYYSNNTVAIRKKQQEYYQANKRRLLDNAINNRRLKKNGSIICRGQSNSES